MFKWLRRLLRGKKRLRVKLREHHRTFSAPWNWGFNIRLTRRVKDTNIWECYGHYTPLPIVGDLLIYPMQSENVGRFAFIEVKPCWDPEDMFFGKVEFLGYEEVEIHQKVEFFDSQKGKKQGQ